MPRGCPKKLLFAVGCLEVIRFIYFQFTELKVFERVNTSGCLEVNGKKDEVGMGGNRRLFLFSMSVAVRDS